MVMSLYSILILAIIALLVFILLRTSIGILPSLIKIAIVLFLIAFVYSLMPR